MSGSDVLPQLQEVFRNVFFNNTIALERHHTALDIDGWDSLTHVRLIMAIERHFEVRLAAAEVLELNNVDDLANLVAAKLDP